MADVHSLDLLVTMVGDLNRKVDGMAAAQVTRFEFEQLSNRIDKFVLHTEFEQYKELAQQKHDSLRMSFEAQLEAEVATISTRQDTLDAAAEVRFVKVESKGSWPPWLVGLIVAVIAAVFGGVSGSYSYSKLVAPQTTTQQVQTQHVGQP